ncbi:MAG TPA: cytochrome c [Longimicrobiaceae bacterium]|nr:cytochrome c [Longimicrobiaceae bacterium]
MAAPSTSVPQRPRGRRVRWLFVALVAPFTVACGGGNVPLPDLSPSAVGDTTGLVARGEYLVRSVAVCGHCHAADPEHDPDGPLSGGLAFHDWRLGTIRASNLTPDSATGIGAWSEAEIVRAIRTGEDREGHLLAPVMPYEWLHGLSDRDALAIARYLKSLPPVQHEVENDPNLVFRLAKIFFLGPKHAPHGTYPVRAGTAEYGQYLALHAGLCVDCHTPRTGIRSTPDRDRLFAGDASPPKGLPANPDNITPDSATGIGGWSESDFLRALRTGVNPAGDTLHPFMPWREYRRMTDEDLAAIYRYLRTIPPIRNRVPEREGSQGEE